MRKAPGKLPGASPNPALFRRRFSVSAVSRVPVLSRSRVTRNAKRRTRNALGTAPALSLVPTSGGCGDGTERGRSLRQRRWGGYEWIWKQRRCERLQRVRGRRRGQLDRGNERLELWKYRHRTRRPCAQRRGRREGKARERRFDGSRTGRQCEGQTCRRARVGCGQAASADGGQRPAAR